MFRDLLPIVLEAVWNFPYQVLDYPRVKIFWEHHRNTLTCIFYTELNVPSTEADEKESIKIHLKFKRYLFDSQKRIIQTS